MIALDTNILVHAHRVGMDFHERAALLVKTLAESPMPWAIPWPCIHEFLAVVTRPGYFVTPSTNDQALRQVSAWLASPSVRTLGESHRHWHTLNAVVQENSLPGNHFHDAKIAAICIDHDVDELWTMDREFRATAALKVRNPFS